MSSKSNPEQSPAVTRRQVAAPFCMFDSLQKSRPKAKRVRPPTESPADDKLPRDPPRDDEA